MSTVAGNVPEQGLNVLEFARARKDIALGRLTQVQWSKASIDQQKILHQVELAIQSISIEDLSELDESDH